MIVSWPAGLRAHGQLRDQFHHLIDVMPTVLQVAGIEPPASVDGVAQQPIDGTSFLYALSDGATPTRHTTQYFELFGNRAMVADGWKAVVLHRPITWDFFRPWNFEDDAWELYQVDRDPNELHDLAQQEPAKLAELQALFDSEARRNHVYPLGPDTARYRRAQVTKQLEERKNTFTYAGIVRGISMDAAPPTVRSAFDLRASFEMAPSGTQVLVAHGGAMGGFSVYVKDRIPVYCYNLLGGDLSYVRGTDPLAPGRHELLVQFRPEGNGAATVTMQVDGADHAEGTIPKLTPIMYEASDGFSVGVDQGSPVSPETVDAVPAAVDALRFEFVQRRQNRGGRGPGDQGPSPGAGARNSRSISPRSRSSSWFPVKSAWPFMDTTR